MLNFIVQNIITKYLVLVLNVKTDRYDGTVLIMPVTKI